MGSRARLRAHSWFRATGAAVVIVVVLGLVFAVVPDRLTQLIERRGGGAFLRDFAATAWFLIGTVGVSWALVRLQRRGVI